MSTLTKLFSVKLVGTGMTVGVIVFLAGIVVSAS